jgi:hypothetical protein
LIIGFTSTNVHSQISNSKPIWSVSNTNDAGNACIKSVPLRFTGYVVALIEINKETGNNTLLYHENFSEDYTFALNKCIDYIYNENCVYRLWVSAGNPEENDYVYFEIYLKQ